MTSPLRAGTETVVQGRSSAVHALHLVARLAGTERAREVRRGIQYDPHPPV